MKFKSLLFFLLFLIPSICISQNVAEQFETVYKKFTSHNILDKLTEEDKKQIQELDKLMNFLRGFTQAESSLNGKVDFGFSGNQTDLRNLVRLNAGISIDHGNYPYQLDFSTSVQTLINNGAFQENISNINVSFDYTHMNVGNGLWLENYALLKRFGDDYLGITQRYEVGAGIILNFRSKKLTPRGQKNRDELNRKPTIKTQDDDLIICYEEICSKVNNAKQLSSSECGIIDNTRKVFRNANRKKYNKLRLALLTGVFYEIDQSQAVNNVNIFGRDTVVAMPFPTQSFWRWELRPTFDWKPDDRFRIKVASYFKLPLTDMNQRIITDGNFTDERMDYFMDLQARISAALSSKISFGLNFRYIYDNAPNRAFIDDGNGSKVLLIGQKAHQVYSMTFGFGF